MHTRNRGILLSYVKIIVNMVCGLLLSVALLRLLGDTEYGIYQTVAAFANYLVLLEFGMGTVMMRNLSACRGENGDLAAMQRQVGTIWSMTGGLCLLIGAMAAGFYLLMPSLYARSMTAEQIAHGQEIFLWVVGHVVFSFLAQTAGGVLLALEHYSFSAVEGMIRTVARVVILLVALRACPDARYVAAADLVLSGISLAVTGAYCRRKTGIRLRFGRIEPAIARSAAPLAAAIFLQAIVNQAYHNVDKFLIGVLLSPESVAVYSVGLYIFGVFSSLTTVTISMYGPEIVQKHTKGETLLPQLVQPCRLTAVVGGMILFGFLAAGQQFICVFYGEGYGQAWLIALLLMGSMYPNAVNGVLVNVLDAENKRMGRSVILLLSTALNVVLTIFWLRQWGIAGAAWATAVSTVLGQVILGNWYYHKQLRIPVWKLYAQAFRGVLTWLILGGAIGLGIGLAMGDSFLSMMASGVAFLLCCLPILRKIR